MLTFAYRQEQISSSCNNVEVIDYVYICIIRHRHYLKRHASSSARENERPREQQRE